MGNENEHESNPLDELVEAISSGKEAIIAFDLAGTLEPPAKPAKEGDWSKQDEYWKDQLQLLKSAIENLKSINPNIKTAIITNGMPAEIKDVQEILQIDFPFVEGGFPIKDGTTEMTEERKEHVKQQKEAVEEFFKSSKRQVEIYSDATIKIVLPDATEEELNNLSAGLQKHLENKNLLQKDEANKEIIKVNKSNKAIYVQLANKTKENVINELAKMHPDAIICYAGDDKSDEKAMGNAEVVFLPGNAVDELVEEFKDKAIQGEGTATKGIVDIAGKLLILMGLLRKEDASKNKEKLPS